MQQRFGVGVLAVIISMVPAAADSILPSPVGGIVNGAATTEAWTQVYVPQGGQNANVIDARIIVDSSGNSYVAAVVYSFLGPGTTSLHMLKFNSNGAHVFDKICRVGGVYRLYDVRGFPNGVGALSDFGSLCMMNFDGSFVKRQTSFFAAIEFSILQGSTLLGDGGGFGYGSSFGFLGHAPPCYAGRFLPNGSLLWATQVNCFDTERGLPSATCANDQFVAGVGTSVFGAETDASYQILSIDGKMIVTGTFSDASQNLPTACGFDSNGNLLVLNGYQKEVGNVNVDMGTSVSKIDHNGTRSWHENVGYPFGYNQNRIRSLNGVSYRPALKPYKDGVIVGGLQVAVPLEGNANGVGIANAAILGADGSDVWDKQLICPRTLVSPDNTGVLIGNGVWDIDSSEDGALYIAGPLSYEYATNLPNINYPVADLYVSKYVPTQLPI